MSEAKVNVTVTQGRLATLRHSKMHAHTPNLGFLMRYAQDKNILKTRSKVKITVTRKMVCETPPSQDASTHQIWDSYLKEYRKYALDTKRDRQTNKQCNYYMPHQVP